MSRRYVEAVHVRWQPGVGPGTGAAPVQFLWQHRLYVVRSVLAHWVAAGAWWRSPAAAAVFADDSDLSCPTSGGPAWVNAASVGAASAGAGVGAGSVDAPAGGDPADLVVAPLRPSPKWGQRAWGEPAPDVGAAVGAAAVDDGEREYWRVEADAGRSAGAGVYELCCWAGSGWTVTRVQD